MLPYSVEMTMKLQAKQGLVEVVQRTLLNSSVNCTTGRAKSLE